ncbi:MAG: hypothetical protein IJT00_10645 [Lachnospiraceae bacterium]|nr:hypothetical protein [Lachnospiraceae bacterium]
MKKNWIRKTIGAAAAAMALSFVFVPAAKAETAADGIEIRVIKGWRYAFNADGTPAYGWIQDGGSWYFAGPGGGFVYGDYSVDGKAYTFSDDGTYVCEGVHRDGFEDDLYNTAVINVSKYWDCHCLALDLLNEERARNGLAPLRLDWDLCILANYRACHMLKYNYADHYDDNGVAQAQHIADLYYGRQVRISENLNRRFGDDGPIPDPRSPVDQVRKSQVALINSPPHHVLMLDPKDTAAGFGLGYSPTRELFVQLFAEL